MIERDEVRIMRLARDICALMDECNASDTEGFAAVMTALIISAIHRGDDKQKTFKALSELWDILEPALDDVIEMLDLKHA